VVVCILPFVLLVVAGGAFLVSDEMVLREVLDRLGALLPVYHSEMESMLRGVISARGVSSVVGTLILLLFASQLFAATRLVLNRMFQRRGRSLIHGMLYDLWMILVLAALFLGTMGVSAVFTWLRGLSLLGDGNAASTVFHWAGLLLILLFDVALFAVVYRYVPTRRVGWGSVLAGSLATALLWEVAKELFRLYIEEVGVYSAVYGSLGVTIAVMMWIYYTAIVFVLGAALIRVLEERGPAPPV
jgi:membrane protein